MIMDTIIPDVDVEALPFHEALFPAAISKGVSGGPRFNTGIVCVSSGNEQRTQNWADPVYAFNVTHAVKSQAQLNMLIAFFRLRKGKATGFRFRDFTDYKITGGWLMTGDAATNMNGLQIAKYYIDINTAYYTKRIIKKPVAGTVVLYLDGVVAGAQYYTVDYTTGKITADYIPTVGEIISIDCEFDVPVRFDIDEMPASIDDWDSYSWSGITLNEVKLADPSAGSGNTNTGVLLFLEQRTVEIESDGYYEEIQQFWLVTRSFTSSLTTEVQITPPYSSPTDYPYQVTFFVAEGNDYFILWSGEILEHNGVRTNVEADAYYQVVQDAKIENGEVAWWVLIQGTGYYNNSTQHRPWVVKLLCFHNTQLFRTVDYSAQMDALALPGYVATLTNISPQRWTNTIYLTGDQYNDYSAADIVIRQGYWMRSLLGEWLYVRNKIRNSQTGEYTESSINAFPTKTRTLVNDITITQVFKARSDGWGGEWIYTEYGIEIGQSTFAVPDGNTGYNSGCTVFGSGNGKAWAINPEDGTWELYTPGKNIQSGTFAPCLNRTAYLYTGTLPALR